MSDYRRSRALLSRTRVAFSLPFAGFSCNVIIKLYK